MTCTLAICEDKPKNVSSANAMWKPEAALDHVETGMEGTRVQEP
jgi:hypothetical protein